MKNGPSILVVDDEESLRKALDRFFRMRGDEVVPASTSEEAIWQLENRGFDLLLVDLMLPNASGIDILRKARELHPEIVSIVMTGYGTIPSAIEAIRAGAYHYVTKPFELDDLGDLVSKALDHRRLRQENLALRQELKGKFHYKNIIGKSPLMEEVYRLVDRVATSDSTVLILGESGTGKELVARAIHYGSARSDKPLVAVNCAAIPETLLEAELFGHVKGAFTGAVGNRIGRFEAADGGTIFLDEIGDMSPKLQVKVLRILQERRFEPVGSSKTKEIDVRVITATHQDLQRLVSQGKFREDLYYRLNVIPIVLPPLRERKEDIPLLLNHFLKKFNQENRKEIAGFSKEAVDLLLQAAWPGNIRELENLVERLVILKRAGTLEGADLPPPFHQEASQNSFTGVRIPDAGISFREMVASFESALIRQALEKSGGNRNKAAALLQLNRTTLLEKLRKIDDGIS